MLPRFLCRFFLSLVFLKHYQGCVTNSLPALLSSHSAIQHSILHVRTVLYAQQGTVYDAVGNRNVGTCKLNFDHIVAEHPRHVVHHHQHGFLRLFSSDRAAERGKCRNVLYTRVTPQRTPRAIPRHMPHDIRLQTYF